MRSAVSSFKGTFFKSNTQSNNGNNNAQQTLVRQEVKTDKKTAYDQVHEKMDEKIKQREHLISEGDEEYDYGAECEEVYLKRERPNTYLEEIYFKKDVKNGLVYTNEEKMKK